MTFVYAARGPVLRCYRLDTTTATLAGGDAAALPANVQYAWPDPMGRLLYVASSDGAPALGVAGQSHHLSAFRIDPASGVLSPHGAPLPLPARPIHLCLDREARHALLAFNNPAALRVVRLDDDGAPERILEQPETIETGIFAHQVRVTPEGSQAILVSRGHDAREGRPEQPGALNVFAYANGLLKSRQRVAPEGGYGFGPRHLDFHPAQPWVYVGLERQNRLAMFARRADGSLEAEPRFQCSTLDEERVHPSVHQLTSAIHVHPAGHVVYVANRAPEVPREDDSAPVPGGDNSIAVFAIDPRSGEPRKVQNAATGGLHCRTFQIEPQGRLMVAAHVTGMPVVEGGRESFVPPGLSVFRIAPDGRLTLLRRYEEPAGPELLFWMGMVTPAAGG